MKKKILPLNDDVEDIINDTVQNFLDTGIGTDILSDVKNAMEMQIETIVKDYKDMGYHIIGLWLYDEETEEYTYTGLSSIVNNKLTKYYPYLKVFNDEFIYITGREENHEEYSGNNSVSQSGSNNKTKTKVDDFTNNTHGTNRSAHEESPITSAPITSAPTESSTWNLDNPTSKDGEQFDHHNASHNATNVMEGENISHTEMGNNSGSKDSYFDNPDQLLKILKFNIEDLNLTRICYLIVNSIIEEKVTIY